MDETEPRVQSDRPDLPAYPGRRERRGLPVPRVGTVGTGKTAATDKTVLRADKDRPGLRDLLVRMAKMVLVDRKVRRVPRGPWDRAARPAYRVSPVRKVRKVRKVCLERTVAMVPEAQRGIEGRRGREE